MEMPSSISSPLSSTASLSSLSLASSGLFHTGTPHRPSAPKMKAMAVEFWYEDDAEDPVPAAAERFSCVFLEECRLCKRRLGAGRDAYMFGGEAAFCSEECRQEWMELLETSTDEKIRRRSVAAVKACRSSRIPAAAEMYSAAAQYRAGGALVAG